MRVHVTTPFLLCRLVGNTSVFRRHQKSIFQGLKSTPQNPQLSCRWQISAQSPSLQLSRTSLTSPCVCVLQTRAGTTFVCKPPFLPSSCFSSFTRDRFNIATEKKSKKRAREEAADKGNGVTADGSDNGSGGGEKRPRAKQPQEEKQPQEAAAGEEIGGAGDGGGVDAATRKALAKAAVAAVKKVGGVMMSYKGQSALLFYRCFGLRCVFMRKICARRTAVYLPIVSRILADFISVCRQQRAVRQQGRRHHI